MRIWFDMTAPAHPVVFRPVIARMREMGHDVSVTARDYAQTLPLLARLGIPHTADRKSTRLNSSHANISYAVFCLKKKNNHRLSFTFYLYTASTRHTYQIIELSFNIDLNIEQFKTVNREALFRSQSSYSHNYIYTT